eukprot:TRINITY_DN50773_c0_g1_i1.p1 TRINITY_DN50773_c0_g1~~TRINITY_DN50773_c0_g1_i1.p1  ORF type:complete len:663 (+),score=99.66 TRINITY_DN50773_c0_g1_i1:134-1990(+)
MGAGRRTSIRHTQSDFDGEGKGRRVSARGQLSGITKSESRSTLQLEKLTWSPLRRHVDTLLTGPQSWKYESLMASVILYNVIIMIVEVDYSAQCEDPDGDCIPLFCEISNHVLLGIYTVDLFTKIYVERRLFLTSSWNRLDLCIVLMGYAEYIVALFIENTQVLSIVRLLRLARIMRVARLFEPIPELYKLIIGFSSTVKAIFWGFMMIMVLLLVCAIVTTQVVQSSRGRFTEDSWCSVAFSSVWNTILFYFQTLVSGDSWGTCAVPLILADAKFFVVFGGALILVQLGFTNLVLSVIVDAAAASRDDDKKEKEEQRRIDEEKDVIKFYEMMKRMDDDESGTLSFAELMRGYRSDEEVQEKMGDLGIDEEILAELMKRMDGDGSGNVSYQSFCDTLKKAKRSDDRIEFLLLKLHVNQVGAMVECLMDHFTGRKHPELPAKAPPVWQGEQKAAQCMGHRQIPVPPQQKLVVLAEELSTVGKGNICGKVNFQDELQRVEEQLSTLACEAEAHAAALAQQTYRLTSCLRSSGLSNGKSWSEANESVAWEHCADGRQDLQGGQGLLEKTASSEQASSWAESSAKINSNSDPAADMSLISLKFNADDMPPSVHKKKDASIHPA